MKVALRAIDILTRVVVMIALVASLFFNWVQYHSDDTWAQLYDKQRTELGDVSMRNFQCVEILKAVPFYDKAGRVHHLKDLNEVDSYYHALTNP